MISLNTSECVFVPLQFDTVAGCIEISTVVLKSFTVYSEVGAWVCVCFDCGCMLCMCVCVKFIYYITQTSLSQDVKVRCVPSSDVCLSKTTLITFIKMNRHGSEVGSKLLFNGFVVSSALCW